MKILKNLSIFALSAMAMFGLSACSDDNEPGSGGGGNSPSIRIDETTYNSVTFTLSSTSEPAPTLYVYSAVPKGGVIVSPELLYETGTKQPASKGTYTLSGLIENQEYTLIAVAMGQTGLSELATAEFTTPEGGYGPQTPRSMGVRLNEVTQNSVNMTYLAGEEAALGMVAVWGRIVLENQLLNARNLEPDITAEEVVAGLLFDQGYGKYCNDQETVTWEERLFPNAEYVVMTIGLIDENTPGDVQFTHFTTGSFIKDGEPEVTITLEDINYLRMLFHYELNDYAYGYMRFITEKSEIDEFLQYYSEEDLREFVRFSDGLWEDFGQTESQSEGLTVGWGMSGTEFTALAVAVDPNLMASENLARLDVTLPDVPEGTAPATYTCYATNVAATNCDVHFDFDDTCMRAYFRIGTPEGVQATIEASEVLFAQNLWYEGWAVPRSGAGGPTDPIADNDIIQMDLVPGQTYVIASTALNYDGVLSGIQVSEPFTMKELTFENSEAEVSIQMDQIGKYQARAIYRANDKTRVLYHAMLESSEPEPDFTYLYSMGNVWSMSNHTQTDEWNPDLNGETWTWFEMTADTEYVYYYCAEDINGAVTPIAKTSFKTLPVTSGPNPSAQLRVYDITSTTCKFDIEANQDVAEFRYLTVQEEMLNWVAGGTEDALRTAVYDYVLLNGIRGTESIYGQAIERMNPGANYYTGVIVYGSDSAENFTYTKFTTASSTSTTAQRMFMTIDPSELHPVTGGEAKGWEARKQLQREAADRIHAQEKKPTTQPAPADALKQLTEQGYVPLSLKEAYKLMPKYR